MILTFDVPVVVLSEKSLGLGLYLSDLFKFLSNNVETEGLSDWRDHLLYYEVFRFRL